MLMLAHAEPKVGKMVHPKESQSVTLARLLGCSLSVHKNSGVQSPVAEGGVGVGSSQSVCLSHIDVVSLSPTLPPPSSL